MKCEKIGKLAGIKVRNKAAKELQSKKERTCNSITNTGYVWNYFCS